jgi:TRAP-type transport system periplasmic protein
LKKELKVIGDKMISEWLKLAGDEGKTIIDNFNKK